MHHHVMLVYRYYLLDFARTFPAESAASCEHMPAFGATHLYRLLRPEYLQQRKADGLPPLSADAFFGFAHDQHGRPTAESRQHNRAVWQATEHRHKKCIMRVVELMRREHAMTQIAQRPSIVSEWLHAHGVNMRHLGLIRWLAPPYEMDYMDWFTIYR